MEIGEPRNPLYQGLRGLLIFGSRVVISRAPGPFAAIHFFLDSPAALLLKPHEAQRDPLAWMLDCGLGWFFWLFNGAFALFTQIGFVVLVGLASKNAILIVEFAKQRREVGGTRRDATLEACRLRLRPIWMTSFAFILGVVPLVLATGAGAERRHGLDTAVFAGMLGVTLFGIFLTPVFFYVIQWFGDRAGRLPPGQREA